MFRRGERRGQDMVAPTLRPARALPEQLLWLSDSPMFIDADQVAAFYDATIRPEFKEGAVELSDSLTQATKIGGGLDVGSAFPWVKASINASGERSRATGIGKKVTLQPVDTAQRQLVHLALHYMDRYMEPPHSRIRIVTYTRQNGGRPHFDSTPAESPAWDDPAFVSPSPRAIVFLDLPPGTRFIPTALETVSGKVERLYERLMERSAGEGEQPPQYPGSGPEQQAARDAYWRWFDEHVTDVVAVETVEAAVSTEPIAWIDYRVGLGVGRHFLHLHVAPRGKYDTGSFAYQFVKRGSKHGLRLVGTLKSEPDMNVLAVFEK